MNELPLSRLEELENLSDRLARELELESKKGGNIQEIVQRSNNVIEAIRMEKERLKTES